MGCCGKNKKKLKSKSNVTNINKNNKIERTINDTKEEKKISIDEITDYSKINENQLLKTEPNIQEESSLDYDIDNISQIKTYNDLQKSIEKNDKSISIVLFYGQYCPYSKRTIPSLRQWAQMNNDRIFLYEVDVEQALKLAEYYHIRSIPTIMAFEKKNLLAPIWQRTANNVLSSSSIDKSEPIEEEEFDNSNDLSTVLNSSLQKSDHIEPSKDLSTVLNSSRQKSDHIEPSNETKDLNTVLNSSLQKSDHIEPSNETKDLPILNQIPNDDNENTIDQSHSSKSITSSIQSSYFWNPSTQSLEMNSQKSSNQFNSEYNGRMISQSTISNSNQSKKKRTWNEYFNDNIKSNEYSQHIDLPTSNEIFYKKQFNQSISSDRFSILTSQHVQETNHSYDEICILYLGPNRNRGFEDNLSEKILHSSKLSLITLQSN